MPIEDEPLLVELRRLLAASKGRWPEVSRGSRVPYSTITKIHQKVIVDPRTQTTQSLLDYLRKLPEAAVGAPAAVELAP
jgi:predicted transcriptional regulator